jgi:hypothetical protein
MGRIRVRDLVIVTILSAIAVLASLSRYYSSSRVDNLHEEVDILPTEIRGTAKEVKSSKLRPLPTAVVNPEICEGLFWFHAPKTGSTLYMALQHVCSPQAFEEHVANITTHDLESNDKLKIHALHKPFRFKDEHGSIFFVRGNKTLQPSSKHRINIDHNPVRQDFLKPAKHTIAVGMFRDPRSRLISSFLDGAHHEGMNEHVFRAMRRSWDRRTSELHNRIEEKLIQDKIYQLNEYANHPHMIGCYTKMLNGFMCSSPTLFDQQLRMNVTQCLRTANCTIPQYNHSLPLNHTAVNVALRRLRQFRFVGIFERFNVSVHLLHRTMATGLTPSPVELYPQRTTNRSLAKVLKREIRLYDPYDTIIYDEAKKIFEKQLREYNVTE